MKGYPKFRAEIIDQSQIQEITTTTLPYGIKPLMIQAYTSDKGTEKWEVIDTFSGFTNKKGPISFARHGQAQLTVAEILRAGGSVLAKRMVSEDATFANTTIRVRAIEDKAAKRLFLYYYKVYVDGADADGTDRSLNSIYKLIDGENETRDIIPESDSDTVLDVPLFTITPLGRGVSTINISISPNYSTGRGRNSLVYNFKVYANNTLEEIENISFSMNINSIIDGVSQAINPKVNTNSDQVVVKLYEYGLNYLVNKIANVINSYTETNIKDGTNLLNIDFLNGKLSNGVDIVEVYQENGISKKRNYPIIATNSSDNDWVSKKPVPASGDEPSAGQIAEDDLISLDGKSYVELQNGSYGESGTAPITNKTEYTSMLLHTFGDISDLRDNPYNFNDAEEFEKATKYYANYDPVIYDLDMYKIDASFDCGFDFSVKKALIALADARGDFEFFCDLGKGDIIYKDPNDEDATDTVTSTGIVNAAANIPQSAYTFITHNYFDIYDPYTRRQITVTLPFLLATKMVSHINSGVSRPFAGIANNITFPEIIEGSINYIPYVAPAHDYKQTLTDANVNFIIYYDGVPVLDTEYTNNADYSQLSFVNNVMNVQQIIKRLRSECPRKRYTFVDGSDLDKYIEDAERIINDYKSQYKSIEIKYMADEAYEANKIFYAVLTIRFKEFFQEEYFKIIAIN